MIAACIRSSRTVQAITKDTSDGTVTIIAIIEPFTAMSLTESLFLSVNKQISKNGNKNQRGFINICQPVFLSHALF